MDNQNNIQDELRGLNSGLPVDNSSNPFSVPEGYFDGLAASILAKVKEESFSAADELQQLSPFLAGISKKSPYSVPDGYFEENLASLSQFTKEEESPVLAAIGKALPYTVPQGYFENLSEQVLAKVAPPKTKVVSLFSRKWMRVAAAAVVGGIITLGGYRFLSEQRDETSMANADKPGNTTQNLVAKNEVGGVVQELKKASTEELDNFISAVPLNRGKLEKTTSKPAEKAEVKELLKDVSQKEIDAFLEQLPTADEDLLVID